MLTSSSSRRLGSRFWPEESLAQLIETFAITPRLHPLVSSRFKRVANRYGRVAKNKSGKAWERQF